MKCKPTAASRFSIFLLKPERRKEIAQEGARARWSSGPILKVTHGSPDHPLKIGNIEIPCYVLEDGTRVLTQHGFYEAIGRSGKPARGRGSSLENIAPFLALQNLKPFINNDLINSTMPIKFMLAKGAIARLSAFIACNYPNYKANKSTFKQP